MIKLDPKNARLHNETNKSQINKSLKELGAGRSIVIDNEDYIVAGNGVFEQAESLGIKTRIIETDGSELVVIKRTDLNYDDEARRKLAIADNATGETSEWNFEELTPDEIAEWGIEAEEPKKETIEDDFDTTPPEIPKTILGDLYEIGEHRLLCGDSTCADTVHTLMDGNYCNAVITSPPYWNQREYSHWEKFEDYILDMQLIINASKLESNSIVFWNIGDDSPNHRHISAHHSVMLENCGLVYIDSIIWKKQGVTGIRLSHQKTKRLYYPGFSFENCLVFQKDNTSFPTFDKSFIGKIPITNVWEISTDNNKGKKHSAPFPVKLPATAIMCYTNELLNKVYDPFCGGGTTMVAAHQLNRKCYGMELDPKYCDVIVSRMMALDNSLTVKRNGEDVTEEWQENDVKTTK